MKVAQTALVAAVIAVAIGGAQAAVPISGRGTWETTLQYRDLDANVANGPEAFYDTALDITWLRDANVNRNNNINGKFLYWQDAVAWADKLVVNGFDGWRLPTMVDTGALGCDFSFGGTDCGYNPQTATSELAHLFFVSLGNRTRCPPGESGSCVENNGWGFSNSGAFQNMQSGYYATNVEYALDPSESWILDTREDGLQIIRPNNSLRHAMVVHAGAIGTAMPFTFPDPVVVPIPEPESYALMLTGLGIVGSLIRRRRAASA